MSFLDIVKSRMKREMDAYKRTQDVKSWRSKFKEDEPIGVPVHEDSPEGYFRGFDKDTGTPGLSAQELLERSTPHRERQQQLAMKYKGAGFPTVDWPGPQGAFFTDGKPEYMYSGTQVTPEQMGYAFDPSALSDKSPVTGLVDPVEKAKFSDGPGSVTISDARRILPKIITDDFSEVWNEKYRDALNQLPYEDRDAIRERTKSGANYDDILNKNSSLLTPLQAQIIRFGKSLTPEEANEIESKMAFDRPDDPRLFRQFHIKEPEPTFAGKGGRFSYQITTGRPDQSGTRLVTPEDLPEGYNYSHLDGIRAGRTKQAISALPAGNVPGLRAITKGQLVRPNLPEWMEKDQVKPLLYDPKYTGRLIGEASYDEDIAAHIMQTPGMLANFLSKHVIYISALDNRPAGEKLVQTSSPVVLAPSISMGLNVWGSAIASGAAAVLGIGPEIDDKYSQDWIERVRHIPDHVGGKEKDQPSLLQDVVDHFGPNFWEIGYGMTFGLYQGFQKYVNPFSRKNVWSSEKSLRQGYDEFTHGTGNMAAEMLNSAYRSVPGVDWERMMRERPVEVFLNLTMVRTPLVKMARGKAAKHRENIANRLEERTLFIKEQAKQANRASEWGHGISFNQVLGRRVAKYEKLANDFHKMQANDLAEARAFDNIADALQVVAAPSVFTPLDLATIGIRRLIKNPGQGFLRYLMMSPMSRAMASKALAVFHALEREGLSHSRKSTMEMQELAMAMRDATPESVALSDAWQKAFYGGGESPLVKMGMLDAYSPIPMVDDVKAQKLIDQGMAVRTDKGVFQVINEASKAKLEEMYGSLTNTDAFIGMNPARTFQEMAWMEHRGLFFDNPKRNLVNLDEFGTWRLTDVGKQELQLGINQRTGIPFNQSKVSKDVLQLRSEIAGKLAVMNTWGLDLVKKSLSLSDDAVKLNLVHSPKQLRQMFWAQLYEPAALKAVTIEEIARRQSLGESRSVAAGPSGSLLENDLRSLGIPIEARLVRVGEMIPEKLIKPLKEEAGILAKAAGEGTKNKPGYTQSARAALDYLLENVPGMADEFKGLVQMEDVFQKLKEYEGTFKEIISSGKEFSFGKGIHGAEIKNVASVYKAALKWSESAVKARTRSQKLRIAAEIMENRNKGPGGFGMTDDFFRTAVQGMGRLSNMVEMHKIYRDAAKQTHIAKNYKPGKGWLMMPDETLYKGYYDSLSFEQLVDEARRAGIGDDVINAAKKEKGANQNKVIVDELNKFSPKRYGELAGKWVHEDVWFHIVNGQKFMDDMQNIFPKLISKWKSAHTAWSPTTTIRNVITNVMYFAPMAGISLLNPNNWKYYRQAIKDAFSNKKSQHWKETFEDGVFESTFMTGELGIKSSDFVPMQAVWKTPMDGFMEFFGLIDRLHYGAGANGWIKKRWHAGLDVTKLPGIFYSKVCDDIFRQAYHHKYKNRVGRSKAASGAMEKFIDYKNVPGFVNILRMPFAPYKTMAAKPKAARGVQDISEFSDYWEASGKPTTTPFEPVAPAAATSLKAVHFLAAQPFLTFSVRAIPLTMEWMARNPIQAKVYMAIHDQMTALSFAEAGITPEGADRLYGMTAGMNQWQRFKYAPTASMSVFSLLDDQTRSVPAYGSGTEVSDRAIEKVHTFVDTNFLNPFSYATPSLDPVIKRGLLEDLLESARRLGIANHFYFSPIFNAVQTFRQNIDKDDVFSRVYNGLAQAYLAPIAPSPTDIATIFGGSTGSDLRRITGVTAPEFNRYKGGRFWEKGASLWQNWVERDERVRPTALKVLDLLAAKSVGYTRTQLVIARAKDFNDHITRRKAALAQKHGAGEVVINQSKIKNDKQLRDAAQKLVETREKAKIEELIKDVAAPSTRGLVRILNLMPPSDALADIRSRAREFLEFLDEESLEALQESVRAWVNAEKEYINARRTLRTASEPLTEQQKKLLSPSEGAKWRDKFRQGDK